jgi:vitamin K-dependent gamma-carboxylase
MNIQRLFKPVDNIQLILFRMVFGLLIALETGGAIATGWVKRTLIDPSFTFPFFGLDVLQPLPGNGMYIYFSCMAVLGLLVMVGLYYRASIIAFTVMWTSVYLMQKSSYNNHYYLLVLLCFLMCLVPAHASHSIDAHRKQKQVHECPAWCIWIFIAQIGIVYTFAAIAKLHGDWLSGLATKAILESRSNTPVLGLLFGERWFQLFVAYAAIAFDLLITPLLLWPPTRTAAFVASLCFHLFNSYVFQIGIFPYLSIAFALFFYPPATLRNVFLRQQQVPAIPSVAPSPSWGITTFLALYVLVQLALPLRHHWIKGDVLWTEEGHRHAWRMMLRSKRGQLVLRVQDVATGEQWLVHPSEHLTRKQAQAVAVHPDMLYAYVQFLKRQYAGEGRSPIEIYAAVSRVSVNRRPYYRFVDGSMNLAAVQWNAWGHNDWILHRDLD